jgi:hydrogenase maturation protease
MAGINGDFSFEFVNEQVSCACNFLIYYIQPLMSKNGICLIGIGNTLRSDDGVGALICNAMEERSFSAVHIIVTQQLDMGLAEELAKFSIVIFIDASGSDTGVSFTAISNEPGVQTFTHHINAATLAALTTKLYGPGTDFYICAVGGFNFEMGTGLSNEGRTNAEKAIELLTQFLEKR